MAISSQEAEKLDAQTLIASQAYTDTQVAAEAAAREAADATLQAEITAQKNNIIALIIALS